MNQTALAYEKLIGRFVKWAQTQSDIRAAIIVGSRARVDCPSDEWADLDLVVIVTKPERYLSIPDWIKNIGDFWITHVESTATGDGLERRVLFEDGLDVDFSIVPVESAQQLVQDGQVADLIHRGIRVLLDKDGLTAQLMSLLPPLETLSPQPPSQREFLNVINDFLYHTVWTVKKLRRGELWTAKLCLDSYMKWRCILRMIEWHAHATHGWNYDTWFGGRFLEQWAHPRAVEGLRDAFTHYDKDGIRHALLATMDLFRWLAMETAKRLRYPYPTVADERVTELVRIYLSEKDGTDSHDGA